MKRLFYGLLLGTLAMAGAPGIITLEGGQTLNFMAINKLKQCIESGDQEMVVVINETPTVLQIQQISRIDIQQWSPSGEGWWCLNADLSIVLVSGETLSITNVSLKSLNLTIENPNNGEIMAFDLFIRKGQTQGGGLNVRSIQFSHP